VDKPRSLKHPERYEDAPDEDTVMDDDDVEIGDECKAETEVEIDKTLERAMQNGLPAEKEAELRRIVSKTTNVFRTRLGVDPAVDDKPEQMLLEEGVPPYRAKVRRCRPPQLAFLADKVKELERLGVVEQNTNSRWASAPHSVPTSNAEGYRLTADLRQVNQHTEPIVWPMTDLESCAHRLAASACSASADFSKCIFAARFGRGRSGVPVFCSPRRRVPTAPSLARTIPRYCLCSSGCPNHVPGPG
jgi:hypothetical protein